LGPVVRDEQSHFLADAGQHKRPLAYIRGPALFRAVIMPIAIASKESCGTHICQHPELV
jgi:hypothetical protein